jgi:hypothetical protein
MPIEAQGREIRQSLKLPAAVVVLASVLASSGIARAEVPSQSVGPVQDRGGLYVRERERYMDTRRVFLSSLLVWGGANVAAGIPIAAVSRDAFGQWFGVQTLAWGAVNSAIAVVGLATSGSVRRDLDTLGAVEAERRRMQRFLWINAALDVVYVTAGALLYGLAEDRGARGNGAAILGQGLFLVGFDFLGSFTQGPRAPLSAP